MARILLVEDSTSDAALLERILVQQMGGDLTLVHATSVGEAEQRIREEGPFDCAVLDLNLTDGLGLDTLALFRGLDPRLPVVVVTGQEDAGLAERTVRLGADDFIRKDWLFNRPQPLGASVRNALERRRFDQLHRRAQPLGYEALRAGRLRVATVGAGVDQRPGVQALVAAGADAGVEVTLEPHADATTFLEVLTRGDPPHGVLQQIGEDTEGIASLDTMVALRAALPRSSLIVIADDLADSMGMAALELGADDVVMGTGEWVGMPLWHALRFSFQRRRMAIQMDAEAKRDDLTGLPTRAQLLDRLTEACEDLERGGTSSVTVMFLDLDGFKDINDAFGHAVGDRVLRVVASRLLQTVRHTDAVGRLGGDEFLLITTDAEPEAALRLRDRVSELITTPLALDEQTGALLGVSIGVATAEEPVRPEALLREADERMYAVKLARTDRRVIRPLDDSLRRRLDVELGRRGGDPRPEGEENGHRGNGQKGGARRNGREGDVPRADHGG